MSLNNRGEILGVGESLVVGDFLQSANKQFYFLAQLDGNFVVYRGSDPNVTPPKPEDYFRFATFTHANPPENVPNSKLTLRRTGNVVANGKSVWQSGSEFWDDGKSYMIMQSDGNLVVYHKEGGALWSGWTSNVRHVWKLELRRRSNGFVATFDVPAYSLSQAEMGKASTCQFYAQTLPEWREVGRMDLIIEIMRFEHSHIIWTSAEMFSESQAALERVLP